jgi:hypothetical protein
MLQKEKPKPKKHDSIEEVQAKARAMGLSYGRYIAYMQMQKGAYK